MRAKTILALLFLISLGVVVILCLHALPQRVIADTAAAKQKILVASTTLPAGTLLRAKDVVWQPIGGAAEPGQIFRLPGAASKANTELDEQSPGEVYGAALRASVTAGEPIRRTVIVKPGDRDFLQVVLSPGARAIAIPVATAERALASCIPATALTSS